MNCPIARLAPSPTGQLHLGNAWSFLIAWLACRLEGGKIYLRMEDIDPQRARKEFALEIIKDLRWLGIDWDSYRDNNGQNHEIVWQSERHALYEKSIQNLSKHVYKCYCTRKELREMAGAPQKTTANNSQKTAQTMLRFIMPDMGAPYTGTCRNLSKAQRAEKEKKRQNYCLRLACPPSRQDIFTFQDCILGEQSFSLMDCGGDFALKRSDGVWAYQLAVVSDDMDMGVTQIVRGDDILTSTPRQLYLYTLLNKHTKEPYPVPEFAHIPLLLDENGERLAKRHKSLSLASIREKINVPTKVISYLAQLMGFFGTFYNAQDLLAYIKNIHSHSTKTAFPWEHLKKYERKFIQTPHKI